MKRVLMCLALFAAYLLSAGKASAGGASMIFWYPGEAGTTAEAQPFLDAFTEKLSEKMAGDKIVGRYFNTVKEGAQFIAKDKPAIGIVSFAAWTQNKDVLHNATIILSTLPSPHGKDVERYTMVGRDPKLPDKCTVLTSEPLSAAFVKANLFPDISAGVTFKQDDQLLMALKKISSGELQAFAILTPAEAASLAKISAEWAKGLRTIATSKEVPTARVVLFDAKWSGKDKFRTALLSMSGDAEGKEILGELRLAGFK
jgi:hypothetical protein